MKKTLSFLAHRLFPSRGLQTSPMNTEDLYSLASSSLHDPTVKEQIREYMYHHFENSSSPVKDFPPGHSWINVTQPLSLHQDLKGKIVLLDFFTYCCINCMHILPDLKKLEKKYSVEDGLVVVGVHCAKFDNEKDTKNIISAVRRYEVDHPVINDCDGIIWNAFNVHCWPTLVLLGPSGEIIHSVSGEGHFHLFDNLIQIMLDVAKERNVLSCHALPQIQITNDLKSFSILSFPGKVTSHTDENTQLLAISDSGHHRILVVDYTGTIKFTIGGTEPGFQDGSFSEAKFRAPQGLVFFNESTIYVADTENHAIREINLVLKTVTTVVGTGDQGDDRIGGKLWQQQEISSPWDVCFGKSDNVLLIAMAGLHQIWALYLQDDENFFKNGKKGQCKVIAGSGREENRNNSYPHAAGFAQPSGLTYCCKRDSVFIADSESSTIRELNLSSGKVNCVVGGNRNPSDLFCFGDTDGIGYNVRLQHALGLAWNPNDNMIYVADSYNHKLKQVNLDKNSCSTVKLNDQFDEPSGVCIFQDKILIADTNNHCIKICDPKTSTVLTLEIKFPRPNLSTPITAQKTLSISKNGTTVTVNINLDLAEGVSITEGAPASWLISLADEQFTQMQDSDSKEKLLPTSKLLISVPKFPVNSSIINVVIKGNLYVCKGDICSREELLFVVHLQGSLNFDEQACCDFFHILNK